MATYLMLSTLTDEGRRTLKENPERMEAVNEELKSMGALVRSQYAVLGNYDFVNVIEAPDNVTVTRIALALESRGTIRVNAPEVVLDQA